MVEFPNREIVGEDLLQEHLGRPFQRDRREARIRAEYQLSQLPPGQSHLNWKWVRRDRNISAAETQAHRLTRIRADQADLSLQASRPSTEMALDAFENATVLNEYLGNEYSDLFLRSRRCEMDRFTSQISNKDFEWYLRSI